MFVVVEYNAKEFFYNIFHFLTIENNKKIIKKIFLCMYVRRELAFQYFILSLVLVFTYTYFFLVF
jgi:hypothetical protein